MISLNPDIPYAAHSHKEVVPFALEDAIQRHLIRCLTVGYRPGSVQILGIEGRPGVGKTYGTLATLRMLQVKVFTIAGAEFGNQFEAGPSDLLQTRYSDAEKYSLSEKSPACLLINDMDTAFGNIPGKDTNSSINPYLFICELMAICDRDLIPPTSRFPVPIILTGNKFAGLCEPLTRYGRMELMSWNPTDSDLKEILPSLFPQLNEGEISHLLLEFPGETIAFFATVANTAEFNAGIALTPKELACRTRQLASYLVGEGNSPARNIPPDANLLIATGKSIQNARIKTSVGCY